MERKSILIAVVIILLVAIIGYLGYNQFVANDNQVKVGAATFTLPDGFHKGTPLKNGDTNITNGYDDFFIKDCGKDNITKYPKKYVKSIEKKDNTTKVKIKNFTVNDTVVYKASIVNKTSNVHYWFDYNGEVYLIYSWSANKNFEKIVTDLISSVK